MRLLCRRFADRQTADQNQNQNCDERVMGFLSEAKEGEVLGNQPDYRISESANFENNDQFGCFALEQHGSRKISEQNAAKAP